MLAMLAAREPSGMGLFLDGLDWVTTYLISFLLIHVLQKKTGTGVLATYTVKLKSG
jgi:hypothetical protein